VPQPSSTSRWPTMPAWRARRKGHDRQRLIYRSKAYRDTCTRLRLRHIQTGPTFDRRQSASAASHDRGLRLQECAIPASDRPL
jgi:hypothetical protein